MQLAGLTLRRAIWISLGVVLLLALGWATTAAIIELTKDPRQTISLSEITNPQDNPIAALDGMHQDTAALCAGIEGCIQGYQADHAALRRFRSLESAQRFAKSATDTYQSDWIVIQYTDSTLTPAQRQEIQVYLDGLATSD